MLARLSAILLSVAALIACSGDDDGTPEATGSEATSPTATAQGTPESSGEAALTEAVRAYSEAYLSGDGATAFEAMSARCRDRVGRDQLISAAAAAADQFGLQEVVAISVDQLQGTLARVTYSYDNAALNQQSEPWVFEDGSWRQDDC